MEVKEKLYTVDDLWAMESDPVYEDRYFYLIDGKLFEDAMPGRRHGWLAAEIAFHLRQYTALRPVGEITMEVGYHSPETRYTALLPDVAFQSYSNLPDPPPESYVPRMPDLAVEIQSPCDSLSKLRHKARACLEHGTALVWLVQPSRQGVEVCRLGANGELQSLFLGQGETLGDDTVLPGFELEISKIFPSA